jgi:hypothetical protein
MTCGLLGAGYLKGMLNLQFHRQENGLYSISGGGERDNWHTKVTCGKSASGGSAYGENQLLSLYTLRGITWRRVQFSELQI